MTIEELEKAARRDDYASMAALATAALAAGQSAGEMLRTCYGVPLPKEVELYDAMRAAKRQVPAFHANQPWSLLALARGATEFRDTIDGIEKAAVGVDDQLIP